MCGGLVLVPSWLGCAWFVFLLDFSCVEGYVVGSLLRLRREGGWLVGMKNCENEDSVFFVGGAIKTLSLRYDRSKITVYLIYFRWLFCLVRWMGRWVVVSRVYLRFIFELCAYIFLYFILCLLMFFVMTHSFRFWCLVCCYCWHACRIFLLPLVL